MKPRFVVSAVLFLAVAGTGVSRADATPHPAAQAAHPAARPGQDPGPTGPPQAVEERVVVTADRIAEAAGEVGSTVTVITAEQIAASGARFLADVLERVPGLTLARNGGPGTQTSVFLRGTASNHTLVLIDGVKVNSPSTGAYDLAHLSARRIERVEIVRGAQSPLYGSEALGGVINVITRRGAGPAAAGLAADGGSFGTGSVDAWVDGEAGALRYSAGLSWLDTDGISAATASRGNSEEDGYDNLTVDGSVAWAGGSGWSAEASVRALDARTEIDDFAVGVGPIDDDNHVSDAREVYLGGVVRFDAPRWSVRLALSDSEIDLETRNPDASFTTGFGLDAAIREADAQLSLEVGSRHMLIGGAEVRAERGLVTSETVFGVSGYDESLTVVGIYLHDRIELGDRARLTLGGRHEDHEAFGAHTTFRATGSLDVAPRARLHGSAGTAFRAPSLNDLYFPGFGNPDLEPEESLGLDLGVEVDLPVRGLRADVTGFWNDIDQLVDFGPTGPVNLGEARTSGVEVEASLSPWDRVEVGASYAYTRARDREADVQLVRRPRHQGSIRLTLWPAPGWRLFTEVRSKGERNDSGPLGLTTLPTFAVWNVAGRHDLTPSLGIEGRVENLLDEEYEEVFGFGTPGRSAYLGLTLQVGR